MGFIFFSYLKQMKKMSNLSKPFLKWAGGKTQLIKEIGAKFPCDKEKKFTYIEPFVGSGAVLFWVLNNYPNLEKAVINDANSDLINTYRVISTSIEPLIDLLGKWESEYYQLIPDDIAKKEYFYEKRVHFNTRESEKVVQAALFIFLNKTCFNGLFRVNKKNQFNVPIGSYKKPLICDKANLYRVHQSLAKVEILEGDFEETIQEATVNTYFYIDPPYKPLNTTSSFNSYAKDTFDDNEQLRLKNFCDKLDEIGCKWLLSNSDVKNYDPDNEFFDDLYNQYSIERVQAKRNINSNANKRGQLNELLISNF